MSQRPRYVRRPVLSFAVLALTALVAAGCASIDHIRDYRDARNDFSAAAADDNASTLKNTIPDPAAPPPNDLTYNFSRAAGAYQRWHEVHAAFAALNGRAADELRADQLYGSSRALEILAKSRVDMYAFILENAPADFDSPKLLGTQTAPLSASASEAEKLLNDPKAHLFPRDEYLMRSLKPAVRYEIAYVNAVRIAPPGRTNRTIKEINPIVLEMATADKELADLAPNVPPHVLTHLALSRCIILHNARLLLTERTSTAPGADRFANKSNYDPSDPVFARYDGVKLLADRIRAFHDPSASGGANTLKPYLETTVLNVQLVPKIYGN